MLNTAKPLDIAARLTAPTHIKTQIISYLRRRSGISLIEMCRDIIGFSGDVDWFLVEKNLMIWTGISREACVAMTELIIDGEIEPTITTPLVYLYDGEMLSLPVGNRMASYKKPTWVPMVFAGGDE